MTPGTLSALARGTCPHCIQNDTEALDAIAVTSAPGCDIPLIALAYSWGGFEPEAAQDAWCEFQRAVLRREALATGTAAWVEIYDLSDMRGTEAGHQENAIQMAAAEADEARARLLHGPRR